MYQEAFEKQNVNGPQFVCVKLNKYFIKTTLNIQN